MSNNFKMFWANKLFGNYVVTDYDVTMKVTQCYNIYFKKDKYNTFKNRIRKKFFFFIFFLYYNLILPKFCIFIFVLFNKINIVSVEIAHKA